MAGSAGPCATRTWLRAVRPFTECSFLCRLLGISLNWNADSWTLMAQGASYATPAQPRSIQEGGQDDAREWMGHTHLCPARFEGSQTAILTHRLLWMVTSQWSESLNGLRARKGLIHSWPWRARPSTASMCSLWCPPAPGTWHLPFPMGKLPQEVQGPPPCSSAPFPVSSLDPSL